MIAQACQVGRGEKKQIRRGGRTRVKILVMKRGGDKTAKETIKFKDGTSRPHRSDNYFEKS